MIQHLPFVFKSFIMILYIFMPQERTELMKRTTRSVISVLLSLMMALSLVVFASANALGDVDNDGSITAGDARLALRAAVGLEDYAEGSAEFIAADVDRDGSLTAGDARLILRAAVGLEEIVDEPGCDHDWSEWVSGGANSGYHSRTCSKCNETETVDCTYGEKLPQNPKNPGPATCTQSYTWYQRCTVCNGAKVGTDQKLNHYAKVLVEDKSREPGYNDAGEIDCTAAGWNYYECPLCGANGDTLADLKEALPAPGHQISAATFSVEKDIVCTRCAKTLTPSFNTLVNAIRQDAEPSISFSELTKQESTGELNEDGYKIEIPRAAKILMELAGESISEEDILNEFTAELQNSEPTYSAYRYQSPFLTMYYPLNESMTVSRLEDKDIKSISVEEVSEIDFMSEIPDNVDLKVGDYSGTRNIDLTSFKSLAKTGNIRKITVELIEERYSDLKDSTEETALMHATGLDIRTYPDSLNQNENSEGFELHMDCKDLISTCTIIYYFLVTEDGDNTVYTPLASKYTVGLDIDQHIDLKAGMAVSDLGIDSALLNTFLTLSGLKQGDEVVFLQGYIDMQVLNTNTSYYLFTIAES